MAVTALERKRQQRERDKLTEEERLSRCKSRTLKLDLFKATDAKLIEVMAAWVSKNRKTLSLA